MSPRMLRFGIAALSLLWLSHPAAAHHSEAMFDKGTTKTLQGTINLYQWTNPHCWIQLLVDSPQGPVEWSIEMQDPRGVYRAGWRPDSLKYGDRLTVTVHPAWDGKKVVGFVSATAADGHLIGKSP
jgi:hypothetical protein